MHTRQGVGTTHAHVQNIFPADREHSRMYPPEYGTDSKLQHSAECRSLYGRCDWNCPKCVERMHEGSVRGTWFSEYLKGKLNGMKQQRRAMENPGRSKLLSGGTRALEPSI